MNIREKFELSLCSKKVSTQINNARLYSQKVILYLDILNQNIKVYSENDEDIFAIFIRFNISSNNDPNIQHFQIEGRIVPVISILTGVITFWKNHREAFLTVIHHLLKMFQCKISTTIYHCDSDAYQTVISDLFHLQLEFKTLTIYLYDSEKRNLLWNQISTNFGLVKDLIVCIESSFWFTLKSLLTCTCTTITLEDSRFVNKDLDQILKNWKAGGNPKLDRLTIDSPRFTNNGITILGMNWTELDGKVIQSEDGSKKATLRVRGRSIEVSVTPSD